MNKPAVIRRCRCGHPWSAHEHYRPGSDCGQCGCTRLRRRLIILPPRPRNGG